MKNMRNYCLRGEGGGDLKGRGKKKYENMKENEIEQLEIDEI